MKKLIAIWATVAVLGAVVYALPATERAGGECLPGSLQVAAQNAVKDRMRDPASARLSNVRRINNAVAGEIRAQNAFGAFVQLPFHVTVECIGGEPVVRNIAIG